MPCSVFPLRPHTHSASLCRTAKSFQSAPLCPSQPLAAPCSLITRRHLDPACLSRTCSGRSHTGDSGEGFRESCVFGVSCVRVLKGFVLALLFSKAIEMFSNVIELFFLLICRILDNLWCKLRPCPEMLCSPSAVLKDHRDVSQCYRMFFFFFTDMQNS